MRYGILAGLVLTIGTVVGAQDPAKPDEKTDKALREKLAAADVVVVGKVTQTGLSSASSFDVGVIEVREVLKGDPKTKAVNFRFVSTGSGKVAPYGKVGVDGVWVLGKKGAYLEAREVLLHLPPQEAKAVKEALGKPDPEKEKDR
jgi:hypothetical protein